MGKDIGYKDARISDICAYCHRKPGIKTDSKGKQVCRRCLSVPTVRNTSPQIKRNALCPCGSNKKFKFCCLRAT